MSSLPVRPVVVGVNGSEPAFAAVEWAARHASRTGSALRIVHAFGWPLVHVSSAPTQWTRGLRDEAWTFIEEARTRAYTVDPDLEVAVAVPTSFSAPLLLRESAAASLVAVGTHGLGGFSSLVIGSTGVELAARAAAPIVVVRGRPADDIDPNAPVLVGYDGSAASDLAVAAGFEYAALHKRSVSLLHVSSVGAGPDHITQRMVDLAATWHRVLPEIDVNSREANGHPAGMLTEASQDAALVVVGSRGRGGFRGLVLGSVSQAMLHHAQCPVMVLPPAFACPSSGHRSEPGLDRCIAMTGTRRESVQWAQSKRATVSADASYSDSRKRSRFTTAGCGAATPISLADIRLVLDKLHASTVAQIAGSDTSGADDADRFAGEVPSSDDVKSSLYGHLGEIEAAQQRISDGTYGVCFGCGRPIPVSRLRANPYARHCQSCEMWLPSRSRDENRHGK